MSENNKPFVVVVGSGPTGLALAIELGSRNIPCLVVERGDRVGTAPRAKTTHIRTREIMRRWGIADKLAEASPFGVNYPSHVHFVTRLAGHSLARFDWTLGCNPARDDRYSEHGQWIPQYTLESVLKSHAESMACVQLEYGQEFLSFEQDAQKVRIRVRSVATGAERIIEADYLVGADGARSSIRDQIGSKMVGTCALSRNYNIIFEAPGLANAHPHGPGIMYWHVNSDAPSIIGPMDSGDLWFFMPTQLPAGAILSKEEAADLIRKATGIDLPYRILSSDEWIANALVADRYRQGRVFLAGDACHLHPPLGGYGMNMGVADAVDLGWKIAATLQGWGGEILLNSYEAERHPVHQLVVNEAVDNHRVLSNQLSREGIEDDTPEGEAIRSAVSELVHQTKPREFYALGIVLGCRYVQSPVIATEPSATDWTPSDQYNPSATPGALAPHAWLSDGTSLYDMFGAGMTLLVFAEADGTDIAQARDDAEAMGIPLTIATIPDPALEQLYGAKRALIRPDQYVSWRGDIWLARSTLALACGINDDGGHATSRAL